ncbi:hypothetical protein ACA910_010711 [Epithemia clementina (nom. ined.)]
MTQRRRVGGLETTKTREDDDYNSKKVRRARAYQWHSRWAMPNYKMMIKHVRTTPGIDITEADVDLLPWGRNQRLDRAEYDRLQNGTSDLDTEKAIKDMLRAEEEEEARRREAEEARRRKLAEDHERRRKAAEEAERQRLEAEEAERRRKEAEEAERRRKEVEEAERRRKEAERKRLEEERRLREEEERRRREEAERRRLEEEARRRREEEEERRRREEEERRRREEEERRRREEERRRREEEERRLLEEQARLQREAEERRRKEEQDRLRREAEEAERRRREAEERRRREEEDARRRIPPPTTDGDSPVERAYRCFEALAKPSRETMNAALRETEGLELIESDIDALPWNRDGKDLDYPKLHEMLDREKRRRKAKDLWNSLGKPKKDRFKELIQANPVSGFSSDDISVLSWDPTNTFVIERDDYDVKDARRRRKEIERKRIEERERQRLKEELRLKRRNRPPPVPTGNSPLERAYRWYTRLSGPKRHTFKNVVGETEAMDITKADVDLLPWIKDGALLDFAKLGELLDAEEKKRKDAEKASKLSKGDDGDDPETRRRKKAQDWYSVLVKPKRETMYRLIDETVGMDIEKADVDLLPWDPSHNLVQAK